MQTKNLVFVVCICTACLFGSVLNAQYAQLYALTSSGGAYNGGTVVKMNPDGSGFTKVYDFSGYVGMTPVGNLLQGKDGKLYGICNPDGDGASWYTLFSFDPNADSCEGAFNYDLPVYSGMIQIGDSMCGAAMDGLYGFDPVNYSYSYLYHSDVAFDSSVPFGAPVLGKDGKLYGIANGHCYGNPGFIYSFDFTTGAYTNLYGFGGVKDGCGYGSLIQLADGKLYGLTSGHLLPEILFEVANSYPSQLHGNYGNIFSYDPIANTYTDLHDFDSVNGVAPYGTPLLATDGKLYGVTCAGGKSNFGTLFSFDPVAKTFTHLFDFDSVNTGAFPTGDLMQSTDGNLYGSAFIGGNYGYGTFFQFNPVTNSFKVVASLDSANGAYPITGGFLLYQTATGIPVVKNNLKLGLYPNPATNQLLITANGFQPQTTTIYNLNGSRVISLPFTPQTDISILPPGVYFVEVSGTQGTEVRKLVKM